MTLWPNLTRRESEVATLLACGLGRPAIVSRFGISEKTFDTHRLSLLAKLRLANAAQLARYAIREGLVSSAQEDDAP